MRYHITPVTMTIFNERNTTCWQMCGEDGNALGALPVGMEIGAATMEDSTEVPQNIKNRTALGTSYSTSGYLCKKCKTLI